MKIGMIGLGRMGFRMSLRLIRGGHTVVGHDPNPEAVERLVQKGGQGADSLEALVSQLALPRVIWMMIPAGDPVDQTLDRLVPLLTGGDMVIDGGNSFYKDSMRRAERLKERGLFYLDVGTSGGVWGLEEGYSLMIGGEAEAVAHLRPIFETLAPAPDRGWGHVGPSGSGHFVKMIHNGIEYGMMQALAEGFSVMHHKEAFQLDLHQIAEIWRYGSVVRSWLLDLLAEGLAEGTQLEDIAPYVEDSGEGRWTVKEAIDLNVAAPVMTLSLIQRIRSRDEEGYAERILALLRNQFGGHAIREVTENDE